MPYPGGKHAPGHYAAGVGGPPAGAIFLRSVANFYNSVVDGDFQQAIPNPGSVVVGDDLFVFVNAAQNGIAGPVGTGVWAVDASGTFPVFGRVEMYHRIATGIGTDDDFVFPATGGFIFFAQMISVGNDEQPAKSIVLSQSGPTNGSNGNDWDVSAITVGTDPLDTAVFLLCNRAGNHGTGILNPSVVNNDPSGMQVLGELADERPTGGAIRDVQWCGWYFQFQAVSVGLPLFEQGYLPDNLSSQQWTQYVRYEKV